MAYSSRPKLALTAVVLAFVTVSCFGQPAEPQPFERAPSPAPDAARVRKLQPAIYLKTNDGRPPQFIPDMSPADFFRMYNKSKGENADRLPPPYTFDQVLVNGTTKGNRVELNIDIHFTTHRHGRVRVPLRLNDVIPTKPLKFNRAGRQTVEYVEKDGFVCWVDGREANAPADEADDEHPSIQHKVSVVAIALLDSIGDEQRLSLRLPRSQISQLNLSAEMKQAVATVSSGIVETPVWRLGFTDFTVRGAGGDFRMAWHPQRRETQKPMPAIDVESELDVFIDSPSPGRLQIESKFLLQVRSRGEVISTLQMLLPPGIELDPLETSEQRAGYRITVGEVVNDRQTVNVAFSTPAKQPERVRLKSLTKPLSDAEDLEVGRLEVVGAVVHTGFIDVTVDSNLTARWTPGPNVFKTDNPPSQREGKKKITRFETLSQPSSLKVNVQNQRTLATIEPLYVLHLAADKAVLEGRFRCRTGGTQLDLQIADQWQVESVRRDGVEQNVATDDGRISLTLSALESEATEIEIRATCITEPNHPLSFVFPELEFTDKSVRVLESKVIVAPATNVELTPNGDELIGLTGPDRDRSAVPNSNGLQELFTRPSPPLVYRQQTPGGRSVFAGAFRVRQRETSATSAITIQMNESRAEVEQRFDFQVAFVSAGQLAFDVPLSLARPDRLHIFIGDESARDETTGDGDTKEARFVEDETARIGTRTQIRVDLGAAQLGRITVIARYSLTLPTLKENVARRIRLPLILPAESVRRTEIQIEANERLQVNPPDSLVRKVVSEGSAASYVAEDGDRLDSLELNVVLHSNTIRGATFVRRAWLQTKLFGRQRRDRVALLVSTDQELIRVRLADRVDLNSVIAAVNGVKQTGNVLAADGNVVLPIAAGGASQDHVVELAYRVDTGGERRGGSPTEVLLAPYPPEIAGSTLTEKSFWQVVTPAKMHLVSNSAGLLPEWIWRWNSFYWGREPNLGQADLEHWVHATKQDELPGQTNRYLLSSLGSLQDGRLWIVQRSVILAVVSLAVLVMGFVLIFNPQLRHPATFLGAGVAVAAVGIYAPGAMLMMCQMAIVGLILVAVSRLLQRVVSRRQAMRSVVRGPKWQTGDSAREIDLRDPEGSSLATTAAVAVPIALQLPSPDSKS